MPILQLPTNPPRDRDRAGEDPGSTGDPDGRSKPIKVRTGRFGELEEHELIHLIDSLDDERSRARFRESVYISLFLWIAFAWFLIYGPRVLFHQPVLQDPIAMMKKHDLEQLTYLNPPTAPRIKPPAPVLNQKAIQQLQRQAREAPHTPQPPVPAATPTPPPPPQEEAHTTAPPVPQPAMPLPSAPKPSPSVDLPSAPKPAPNFAQNGSTPHDALQNAMRGALSGRSGADVGGGPGTGGPLQAGAQILSDTQGVDFSEYMRRLHNDIQRNWDPLIPEEVQAPLMKKGVTGIRFTILPDGRIGSMILESPSGDRALDEAAWHGITSEGQFPPLPKAFHGPLLELRVGFFYNTPIQ
jgi:TonB family protein